MRTRTVLVALLVALGSTLPATQESHAQFNPEGRRKPRPRPQARPAPRAPTPKPPPAATNEPDEAAAQPDAARGPSNDALIARYAAIVMNQPGAQFPLQRLAQLYRERDGNLDQLVKDFETRAAQTGPSQWNALVALGGIYKQDGRTSDAIATYEKAIAQQPGNPAALTALAHLYQEKGQLEQARQRFDQAVAKLTGADREQTLRTLMQLSLDLAKYDEAKRHHQELVRLAQGSFFVRAELGRELLLRNEHERAVQEYEQVVKAAAGDNRVLAPALRDLGKAYAALGKRPEALKHLRRALNIAGAQAGVRTEIYEIIVDVYRKDEKLGELVAELEKQQANDFERLRLLGSLYEETGRMKLALTTYKQALAKNPNDVSTRVKVVQLLQIQGELDAAIKEYEALIRAAPRNPDFVFQLAEALIQQGDRARALAQLKRLEARSHDDEEILAALADFYERVEEGERALALLKRLTEVGSRDPRHVVELGDRYWQQGQKDKARQTWLRIKALVPDRARALFTLGEVYLEHEMPAEGLEALREAVRLKPKMMRYRKAYALALERTGASAGDRADRFRQYDEARAIWEKVLQESGDDPQLAREARQHIVTLWGLAGQLEQRERPLAVRLNGNPPDLEAGRLLAEVQFRLRQYVRAEKTLREIVKHAPGDTTSLLRLEQVLVQERKLEAAIEVLQRLTRAEPKRAREYYQRMAKYAAELYKDDRAVEYAARAVELSPDDAEGHRKLGEMYRRRQDTDRAIAAFRQAIAKNDRLFAVYFQLAELLLSQGKTDEADQLLRRVVRAAPDEELVAQAARLSMQVNLGRGTLESLEKELLPVALGNPGRPLYRRLLVEVYGAMAFPLVHQAESGTKDQAEQARAALRRIGERAVKPLLDALNDERDAQQRTAIELLAHIQNKGAGPALFAYATGNGDLEIRVRAMLAVGALSDPALLPRLEGILVHDGVIKSDESDPVAVAAAWSVARVGNKQAIPLLRKLLESEAPSLRSLGALGLGFLRADAHAKALEAVARSLDAGPVPRAAAAFALGELGYKQGSETLAQLAEAADPLIRAQATLALARLGAPSAPSTIAQNLVSTDPKLARTAVSAALVYTTRRYELRGDPLDTSKGQMQVEKVLEDLMPTAYSATEEAEALVKLHAPIAEAAVTAAQSSPERARAVLDLLSTRDGQPAFGALTARIDQVAAGPKQAALKVAEAIASDAVTPFVMLAHHPTPDVRATSVRFLAFRPEPAATQAVVDTLMDRDPSVQRAALEAVAQAKSSAPAAAVRRLLVDKHSWAVRAHAARTLGKLDPQGQGKATMDALAESAVNDDYALVRQAALSALRQVDPATARRVAEKLAKQDPEPKVRALATSVLTGASP